MNGRIYDPLLRRFVSPDNYVQDPYNTQSYNRYAYVWNNPLMYTDPSGELLWFVPILVGAAIAVTMKAVSNIMNGVPFWYGMGKTFTQAIVGGALSFAVGMPLGNMLTTAIFEPGADIGDLGTSFAMGLLQAGLSIGNVAVAQSNPNLAKALSIVSGGISGGLSAAIAGGNFWQGFKQGAFSSGLNTIAMDVIHNAGTEPKSAEKSANTSNSASGGKKQKVADPQPALIDEGVLDPTTNTWYYARHNKDGGFTGYQEVGSENSALASAIPISLSLAASDTALPIGDVAGAIVLAGATTYEVTQRVFVTYTMKNADGSVYVGRTSGYGDPHSVMMNRAVGHHMKPAGYGNPTLDKAVQGYQGYPAIRGREQQLIDSYGGVGSSNVGNSIRGVSKFNPAGRMYHEASNLYFGSLSPYTGF